MNLITCDNNCIYQNDGYCTLDTPAVISENSDTSTCIHFIKRNLKSLTNLNDGIKSFSNIFDAY